MQISHQIKKNTLWSILDLGIYPVMMIIATPIFIKNLGYEQYGIWMLASTVNQFIFVLNFGLGDSTIKIISANRALNKDSLISSYINTNWSQAIIVCLLSSIFGCIISLTPLVEYWFHVPNHLQYIAKTVLFLAFTSAGIKFCEMVLLSVFKGYERFDTSSQLSLLSRNSVIIINIILVVLGYSLLEVFLSIVIVNVINVLIQLTTLSKKYPTLKFIPKLSLKLQFIDKDQFWYWLQSVIGLIGFLSDKLLVGYFTNLKTLGLYSIASLIGSQIHNALISFASFMFPKVAYEKSLNNNTIQLYYNSRFIINTTGWFLIILLLFSGDYIFNLWLGKVKFIESIDYIKLYLVYIACLISTIIPYQFINASDKLFYNTIFECLLRSAHLISMLIGFYFLKVEGLIIGLIISTVIIIFLQYYYFHKYIFRINSFSKSLTTILALLSFIPFILKLSFIFKIIGALFLLFTIYLFYYKLTNFRLRNNNIDYEKKIT